MAERDEVLDVDQLSEYLRVPKSTIYRLVRENRIPSHKVGKHWRFLREAVDRWLEEPAAGVDAREGVG
jgi:excisionase family DNA binding protein